MCYTAIWLNEEGHHHVSLQVGSPDRPKAWKDIQSLRDPDRLVMLIMGHHEIFIQSPIDIGS